MPGSYSEATILGAPRYFTGKPCKNGHVDWRYTSSHQCRLCSAAKGQRSYQLKGKEKAQRRHRLSKYDLDQAGFDALMAQQNGSCAICATPLVERSARSDGLCVDHCHETGKVRGLLCNHCNRGLGLFKDRLSHLNSAITYLTRNIA